MEINNLNPNDPQQREIGYWVFRLATAHADRTHNFSRHQRWLRNKLRAAIQRATGQHDQEIAQPPRAAEAEPISLEQARAHVELLKMSLQ